MAKTTTSILIADGARARLFVNRGAGTDLKPALGQEFIGTNLPSRDIASARPGRTFDSVGKGRHAMEPPSGPKAPRKTSVRTRARANP